MNEQTPENLVPLVFDLSLDPRLESWYLQTMAKKEPFSIDISDPQQILEAVQSVQEKVAEHKILARDAQEELRYWQALESRLAALAPRTDAAGNPAGLTIRERVERAIDDAEAPMTAKNLALLIPTAEQRTINWHLWDLAKKGKIQKLSQGVYASNAYKPTIADMLLDGGKK